MPDRTLSEMDTVHGGRGHGGRRGLNGEPLQSPPVFGWEVDLDAYLAACPPEATTRGIFFTHLRDLLRRTLGKEPASLYEGLFQREWLPLQSYPLTEFMRFVYQAARLVHPDRPTSEGLRRMGWLSYESLTATTTGRVVLFGLGNGIHDVIRASPTAYRITLPAAIVRVEQRGERAYRFEMRKVYSFVDSYHYGVLEGGIRSFGVNPTITMRRLRRMCDADFDLIW